MNCLFGGLGGRGGRGGRGISKYHSLPVVWYLEMFCLADLAGILKVLYFQVSQHLPMTLLHGRGEKDLVKFTSLMTPLIFELIAPHPFVANFSFLK
jgi:hypothetical protein